VGNLSDVTVLDPDAAERAARELLDTRVTAVRELATRRAELTRARDAVITAERADAAAWAAAERSGWTETDLRRVGFEPPATRAPGRPRRTPAIPADQSG